MSAGLKRSEDKASTESGSRAAQGQSSQAKQPQVVQTSAELERRALLLKKVQLYKANASSSRKITGGKANKDYIWVNKHELRRSAFEAMEYIVCKDPNVKSRWKKADGTHVCGDLILYEVSKEWREVLDAHSELQAIEAVEGSREELLAFAARNHIPMTRLDQ